MDWRNLPSDSELHRLAFERAAWADPELDVEEIYRSREAGRLELDFNGSSACSEINEITAEIESAFSNGACAFLAYALHRDHDLPLVVWTSKDRGPERWGGHVAVRLEEDLYLDVRGLSTAADIGRYFERFSVELGAPQDVSTDEFLSLIVDEQYREDPLGCLDRLEALLTVEYARILVETHCPKIDA